MTVISIIYGILLILAGIFLLVNPFASILVIGCVAGVLMLLGGINRIIAAYKTTKSGWDILWGVLTSIAGLFIIFNYAGRFIAVNVMVIMIAIVVMLEGIVQIIGGLALKNMGATWGLAVASGALFVILAILLFINPLTGMFMIDGVFAATMIMQGVGHLMSI